MDKKNIIIVAVVVVVLAAGAFLWKGGFLGKGVGTEQPISGVGNKMTDEIQIEILTKIAQLAISGSTSEEEVLRETDKILSNHGINTVEYGMYSQALDEDEDRSAAMNAKFQQIMMEMLKAGAK